MMIQSNLLQRLLKYSKYIIIMTIQLHGGTSLASLLLTQSCLMHPVCCGALPVVLCVLMVCQFKEVQLEIITDYLCTE